MPIYEYECRQCQHKLEKIQKLSDSPLVDCPACGQPGLKKLISAAAFRLKGTGWYETDFKNSGTKPAVESSSDKAAAPVKSAKSGAAGASKASSNA